jgi:uncharacterized repeat protein (TIGR02543 family)
MPRRTVTIFSGWYTDDDGADAYDFDTLVESRLILYAGWDVIEDDGVPFWYCKNPDAEVFSISREAELRHLAQLVNGWIPIWRGENLPALDFDGKTLS